MRMKPWQPAILHRGIAQRHLPALNSRLHDINPKLNRFVIRGKKFRYPLQGTQQHTFFFHKPDNTMCRSVLLAEERDINSYPHSIDETPKFVDNPSSGTAPIEHLRQTIGDLLSQTSVRHSEQRERAKSQSVVKLDTKQWLRMYSRIHHACEIAACVRLPDPIMLTAAAMVRSDSDLSVDSDPERSNKALRAIRNVQTEMGLGGKPDAAAARAQITILATDFAMCANNRVTRSNMTLGQTLRNKGWGELIHVQPVLHELLHVRRLDGSAYHGDRNHQRNG